MRLALAKWLTTSGISDAFGRSTSSAGFPSFNARVETSVSSRAGSISTLVRWSSPFASSAARRSEEHTSELQSRSDLVCRLLLEKKKKQQISLAYSATHNYCHQTPSQLLTIERSS